MYKGIDISKHNNSRYGIDFYKLSKSVDFCILRIGYRGWGDGKIHIDDEFNYNVNKCKQYNIPFGVYFFSQAINKEEAIEEAQFVIKTVKGLHLDYPVVIDTELSGAPKNAGRADKISIDIRTECVKEFCKEIERNKYYAAIYCSEGWIGTYIHYLKSYDYWIANWSKSPKISCGMWQYEVGEQDGVKGTVDKNIAYKNYPAIMKNNNLNGYFSEDIYQVTIWGLSADEYEEVCKWLKEKDFPHDDKCIKGD